MGQEQRARKIRQQINYKPGHPGNETVHETIQHTRLLDTGGKKKTRVLRGEQYVCIGTRALYKRMKKMDRIMRSA